CDIMKPELKTMLEDVDRLMMFADAHTKFPGETVHIPGHYAAARKGPQGDWWTINSTARHQMQVDPEHYSTGLSLLIPATEARSRRQFKAHVTALEPLWNGTVSLDQWKHKPTREQLVAHIFGARGDATNLNFLANDTIVPPRVFEFILEQLEKVNTTSLEMDDDTWEMKAVLNATQDDFRLFGEALSALNNYKNV
ncbi:MAG: hypothetical protein AAF570_11670, partial [Bacteroidota bacterium]